MSFAVSVHRGGIQRNRYPLPYHCLNSVWRGKKALGKTLVCDIYYLLSSREGDGIYEMGHMHEHDSCLSPPLKPHDLKKEENISLKNANVVHLVHINSAHEHRIFHFKKMELGNDALCSLGILEVGSAVV